VARHLPGKPKENRKSSCEALQVEVERKYAELGLSEVKHLTPTGRQSLLGQEYYMPVAKDRFVHFTTADRAAQIVADGKLRMRPPHAKMGVDAVNAVSAVWGWYVPTVQTTHIRGDGEPVALVFTTQVPPDSGFVEEVSWHHDVALRAVKTVSLAQGVAMLRRTPERLPDEQDEVTYKRR